MIAFLIFVIVYGASMYGAYMFIHKAHSKDGKWDKIDPYPMDMVVVFAPIINTVWAVDYIFGGWKGDSLKKDMRASAAKFFNIQK
jgi:hypothetical protein